MGINMQRFLILALLAALAVAVMAVPTAEESKVMDDTAPLLGESADVKDTKSAEAKLAKLEHTPDRIKKSCTADNLPTALREELFGERELGESAKPKGLGELKEEIKKKEKQINKVADACMPGEESSA